MSTVQVHLPKEFADLIIATKGAIEFLPGKTIRMHGTDVKIIAANPCSKSDGMDMRVEVPSHLMSLFTMEVKYLSLDKDD